MTDSIKFDQVPEVAIDFAESNAGNQAYKGIDVTALISGEIRKVLDYGGYISYFDYFAPAMPEVIKHVGDMDNPRETDVYYIVLKKKEEVRLPDSLAGIGDYVIATTKRADNQNKALINSVKSELQGAYSAGGVSVMHTSINDLTSIIQNAIASYRADGVGADAEEQAAQQRSLKGFIDIVAEARARGASDIHFLSRYSSTTLAFTIDSEVTEIRQLNKQLAERLIQAALYSKSPEYGKLGSDDELTDARINITVPVKKLVDGRQKDSAEEVVLRLSKTPSDHGPHTVMRVIATGVASKKSLVELGIDFDIRRVLETAVNKSKGIVLLTGPTGSGKSTTTAALYETIPPYKKIVVLEDPIEYKISHQFSVQSAINPDKEEMGFEQFLVKALRQAPNVIGITEMRTKNVAAMVVSAALTGHLMVSSLHSDTSIETFSRLNDLGISWETLALKGLFQAIAAQRLVPCLCPFCRVKEPVPPAGYTNAWKAKKGGCEKCDGKGYKSRILISEAVVIDDEVRRLLTEPQNLQKIEAYLKGNGWKSMADRAKLRVEQGVIDIKKATEFVPYFGESGGAYSYGDIQLDNTFVSPAVIEGGRSRE